MIGMRSLSTITPGAGPYSVNLGGRDHVFWNPKK